MSVSSLDSLSQAMSNFVVWFEDFSPNSCSRRLISLNYRGGNIIDPNPNKTLISPDARSLVGGSGSVVS